MILFRIPCTISTMKNNNTQYKNTCGKNSMSHYGTSISHYGTTMLDYVTKERFETFLSYAEIISSGWGQKTSK